jgi:hypothetical protein
MGGQVVFHTTWFQLKKQGRTMICGKVTVEQNSGTQATLNEGVQKVAFSEA